jgi:hypothetical protein
LHGFNIGVRSGRYGYYQFCHDLEDEDKSAFDNYFIAYSLVDEQGECIFDESAIPLISERLSAKLINELMTSFG